MEIKKQIYLELNNPKRQKQAIKAWDIIDELAESSVNGDNLGKMIRIINKIFPQKIEPNQKNMQKTYSKNM